MILLVKFWHNQFEKADKPGGAGAETRFTRGLLALSLSLSLSTDSCTAEVERHPRGLIICTSSLCSSNAPRRLSSLSVCAARPLRHYHLDQKLDISWEEQKKILKQNTDTATKLDSLLE